MNCVLTCRLYWIIANIISKPKDPPLQRQKWGVIYQVQAFGRVQAEILISWVRPKLTYTNHSLTRAEFGLGLYRAGSNRALKFWLMQCLLNSMRLSLHVTFQFELFLEPYPA